jgi:hypothetical protein
MNNFPKSPEEFYAVRDDRTNRYPGASRAYQNVTCSVLVTPDIAQTARGQAMVLVAANLLSRWCRNVTLVVTPTHLHPDLGMGTGDLVDAILSQMRDADPFGSFAVVHSPIQAHIALVIGQWHLDIPASAKVFIDAVDWLASISYTRPPPLLVGDDRNWFGAIAAACLGTAQMFKVAVEVPRDRFFREGIFDLFSMKWIDGDAQRQPAPWPSDMNVGSVLMVGSGSVASAAAYCMRLVAMAGHVAIVDKDVVKIENFNRSPIFGRSNFRLPKAEAVANYLQGSSLKTEALPMWWNDFVSRQQRNSFDFDVWLPLANEFNVRLSMQNNVPPLMIHASTTGNWGINHGRHVPGRDDCLADRFPSGVFKDDLTCAEGEVRTQETTIDAALPFLSLFAGLLIAADLVRAQLPGYPQVPNFAFFDWYGAFDTIHAWDRKPRPECICTQQGPLLQEMFNGRTRHRQLFQFNGGS